MKLKIVYGITCIVLSMFVSSCDNKVKNSSVLPASIVKQDFVRSTNNLFNEFLNSRKRAVWVRDHQPYTFGEKIRISQLSTADRKVLDDISSKKIVIFTSIKDGGCSGCDGLKSFMTPYFGEFYKNKFYVLYIEFAQNSGDDFKIEYQDNKVMQITTSVKNPTFNWSSGWPNTLFFINSKYQGALGYGYAEEANGVKRRDYVWAAHEKALGFLRVSSNIK